VDPGDGGGRGYIKHGGGEREKKREKKRWEKFRVLGVSWLVSPFT
jgi:hypothetical protein